MAQQLLGIRREWINEENACSGVRPGTGRSLINGSYIFDVYAWGVRNKQARRWPIFDFVGLSNNGGGCAPDEMGGLRCILETLEDMLCGIRVVWIDEGDRKIECVPITNLPD